MAKCLVMDCRRKATLCVATQVVVGPTKKNKHPTCVQNFYGPPCLCKQHGPSAMVVCQVVIAKPSKPSDIT